MGENILKNKFIAKISNQFESLGQNTYVQPCNKLPNITYVVSWLTRSTAVVLLGLASRLSNLRQRLVNRPVKLSVFSSK